MIYLIVTLCKYSFLFFFASMNLSVLIPHYDNMKPYTYLIANSLRRHGVPLGVRLTPVTASATRSAACATTSTSDTATAVIPCNRRGGSSRTVGSVCCGVQHPQMTCCGGGCLTSGYSTGGWLCWRGLRGGGVGLLMVKQRVGRRVMMVRAWIIKDISWICFKWVLSFRII